jgi:hypothetical protein
MFKLLPQADGQKLAVQMEQVKMDLLQRVLNVPNIKDALRVMYDEINSFVKDNEVEEGFRTILTDLKNIIRCLDNKNIVQQNIATLIQQIDMIEAARTSKTVFPSLDPEKIGPLFPLYRDSALAVDTPPLSIHFTTFPLPEGTSFQSKRIALSFPKKTSFLPLGLADSNPSANEKSLPETE